MSSASVRNAGLLIPAFTPRRIGDLGIGDTTALREWIDLAAEHRIGFLELLPINETGGDHSPYNAISSLALEPAYLAFDDGGVPGLSSADLANARSRLGESVAAIRVDCPRVKAVKSDLLKIAWTRFDDGGDPLQAEFEAFEAAESAWLDDYCLFRWLMSRSEHAENWQRWDEPLRSVLGARAALAAATEAAPLITRHEIRYFAFVQWLCYRQWRAVRTFADQRGVELMGDIPIGISLNSADVFFNREDFDLDWYGGAPPEEMFKHDRFIQRWGQNWGIPIYRWERMHAEGYPWWKQRIARTAEIFSMFRIDHVLGFYRIYGFPWNPELNDEFLDLSRSEAAARTNGKLPRWIERSDETEAERTANRADGDRRLRALLPAAANARVIGEDLGSVPDYVRPHLNSLGIAGFRVPHWDFDDAGQVIPGSELPECSFATYATHDHDPLRELWDGAREILGAARVAEAIHAHDGTSLVDLVIADETEDRTLHLLAEFAGISALPDGTWPAFSDEIQWLLVKALLESNSRHAAIMITDLFGMPDRINYPGKVGPQNWTYRIGKSVDEIRTAPRERGMLEKFRELIVAARR